jgi:hypothetical protein
VKAAAHSRLSGCQHACAMHAGVPLYDGGPVTQIVENPIRGLVYVNYYLLAACCL